MKGLTKKNGVSAEEIKQVLDKEGIKYLENNIRLKQGSWLESSTDTDYWKKSALDKVIITEERAMESITKTLGNPQVTGFRENIMHCIFFADYQINSLDFIKSIPYFQEGHSEYGLPAYIRFRKTGEIEQLTKVIYNDVFVNSYKEPIIIKPEPIVKT